MRSLVAISLLLSSLALAVPSQLSYQGRLLESTGAPGSGVISITFTLYDSATGTNVLWSETQSIALTDGYYATVLGDVAPIPESAFTGDELFLGLTIGGNPLLPRERVVSVPYAVHSTMADRLSGGLPPAGVYRAIYDFEEGSGTTSNDGTGSGHTLTISSSGAAWTTAGHTGKALSFDGASGSAAASASAAFDLGPAASLEAWVFVPAAASGTMTVLALGTTFRLALVNMSLQASFETISKPAPALLGAGPVKANTWVHVAAIYDGLTVRTFVDGLQTSETRYPNGMLKPSNQPLVLGAAAGADFFNGKIDEVRIAAVPLRFPGHRGNSVCGLSTPSTGNLTGWTGARATCQTTCSSPTAHLCDAQEIARSWQYGASLPAGGAWVASVSAVAVVTGGTGGSVTSEATFFKNYRGCCNWDTGQVAVTAVTLPSNVSSTLLTNCTGWTGAGYGQTATTTDFAISACTASLPIACCD